MDSGNSGSLQSSSGGDDEFDSRCGGADSSPLSALLMQPPSVPGFGGGSLIYGLQELRTPPLSSHWCSTSTTAPPLPAGADASASASPPSLPGHAAATAASDLKADAAPAPPRGSRKRARASRRAPTTVLTTDTSNFRAMVQEFTGIPTPPFAASAAATATTLRSRFDHHLFPLRTATATAAAGTASPAALPHYLLRPFAHKLHPYPPSFTTSPSTSSSPAPANVSIAPASTTTTLGTTTAVAASGDSYQQLTAASTSALLGMQRDHNYHSFHQSSSLAGDGKSYAAHPAFDRGIAPPPSSSGTRLPDPAGFLALTHDVMLGSQGPHPHAHMRPRNGGDELSGLVVGGASVNGAGGCKATHSSTTRPLLERNRRNPAADGSAATTTTTTAPVAATAAGMRTRASVVVDSWVCTSD